MAPETFLRGERGAISVDWITLVAAGVFVSLASAGVIRTVGAERSADFETNVAMWRHGEDAAALHVARNAQGFEQMLATIRGLSGAELDVFGGYVNAAEAAGQDDDLLHDLAGAVDATYAERDKPRIGSSDYDAEELQRLMDVHSFAPVIALY